MVRTLSLVTASLLILLAAVGCTKRVPSELTDGRLDPQKELVLTFQDGSRLTGKIGERSSVELLHGGVIYHGIIDSLSYERIKVVNAQRIRTVGAHDAEWTRLTQVRQDLGESPREVVLRMDAIDSIEEVRVDPMRSATRSIFWTLSGIAATFLLSDRS